VYRVKQNQLWIHAYDLCVRPASPILWEYMRRGAEAEELCPGVGVVRRCDDGEPDGFGNEHGKTRALRADA